MQAGKTLRALGDELADVGLAMPNLGDINVQSIAGAINTATHGTGLGLGNIATTIVGMEVVDGRGDVVTCDLDVAPDLLHAARVGVGALGIVTAVTIQCVPAFNLHAHETIEALDDLLDGFDEFARSADHAEFFWMPGARRCQVKRNRRTDEPARPPSKAAYIRDKYIAENLAFDLVCRTGRRFPALAPRIAKLVSGAAGERDLVDRSDRVFASPRHVKFVEMEYGIPIESVPDAVRRVRDLAASLSFPTLFPVEVRVSAADDIPLSTGYGRSERLGRRAPVPGGSVRVVLPGCRGDHGRLRRTAALGQVALPDRRRPPGPVPRVGGVPGCTGPARPGRHVRERLHRPRARPGRLTADRIRPDADRAPRAGGRARRTGIDDP